jgi:rubrerythrin
MEKRFKKDAPGPEAKQRRCLMCGTEFASDWPGERICPRCRATAAWRNG